MPTLVNTLEKVPSRLFLGWTSILSILRRQLRRWKHQQHHVRICYLIPKHQQFTFITMRSLAASPLFAGGDLLSLDEFSLSLLTNHHMIACNQNGVMGTNVYSK